MQSYGLTVDKFLDHAAKWHSDREIVTAESNRPSARIGYAALRERSNRLSGALLALGAKLGDRVATLAWNTQHHLELYYAAMGAGLVCHTLNPRLTVAQIASIVTEAEDVILAVAANLAPLLTELLPLCPCIRHVIVIDSELPADFSAAGGAEVWGHEALLESHGAAVPWGDFHEETPAGLCYTSGTTGRPKGVLYTHRSNYLHTLRALQADSIGLTGSDVVLLGVPMFHANAWGLPFEAPAVGAKLVLPGRSTEGAALYELMKAEKVTIAIGVQTVWMGLVDHIEKTGGSLPDLQRVTIGGSNCPDALIRRMEDILGCRVQTSWGMTELSPMGTIAPPNAQHDAVRASGRVLMGLDLKLTDADGVTLPQQRGSVGHLWVKGASVIDRYYGAESDALDAEGYFETGDLASIDEAGNLTISGRSKDLIKSGGEWINPAEIEAIVGHDPAVALVAVIGRNDLKWGERPLLVIEPRPGHDIDKQALLGLLRGKVANWWVPDEVVLVPAMPLAASGKIDKNQLRSTHGNA